MNPGDEYIPHHEAKFIIRKLMRLSLEVQCHLVLQWGSKYGVESGINLKQLSEELEKLRRKAVPRRVLASKILLEYWPHGLCLYQLAQIDCYLLVYKPKQYTWLASTAWNAKHEKQVLHIEFDRFASNLRQDLQKFYLSNIHTFKHPELSLMICRIQLFDHSKSSIEKEAHSHDSPNSDQNGKFASRAPYYVAFPLNAPYIIHSPESDSYSQLILQSIERTVSYRKPIILEPCETQPIKSLNSMYILFGVSRFSSSLGSWASYGETSFEVSPLGDVESHQSIRGKRVLIDNVEDDSSDDSSVEPEVKRSRLDKSMMRFKGSKYGFEKSGLTKIGKIKDHSYALDSVITLPAQSENSTRSRYASLVPVEKVEFILKKDYQSGEEVSIKFKFDGNDVFGGLHELCDTRQIDINKLPGWLTGENGADSGEIVNGDFFRDKKGGLI